MLIRREAQKKSAQRRLTVGAIVLYLILSQAAQAYLDGNKLLSACESEDVTVGKSVCLGYMIGVADAAALLVHSGSADIEWCVKSVQLEPSQLLRVVEKWLSNHPESLHYNAANLVIIALQEAFPCESEEPALSR